jgi:hypothetical protein
MRFGSASLVADFGEWDGSASTAGAAGAGCKASNGGLQRGPAGSIRGGRRHHRSRHSPVADNLTLHPLMRRGLVRYAMFIRFRHVATRLQANLVTTRRVAGKVKGEHIATLGSVPLEPSVADRIAFWAKAHGRLDRLANRIGPDMAKIMGALHERVPMVTPDEQRELQLENARADERFHTGLAGMQASIVEDHKGLKITVEQVIAANQTEATANAERAAAARDRVERIERGESVSGGLNQPTYEDIAKIAKRAVYDLPHSERLAELHNLCIAMGGEELWRGAKRAMLDDANRARKASVRRQLHAMQALIDE